MKIPPEVPKPDCTFAIEDGLTLMTLSS